MEHRKLVEQMRAAGFVTEQEVADMLGCRIHGKMHNALEKNGLKVVRIPMDGSTGRETRLYPRDEVERYAAKNATIFSKPVAGASNGGKLMKQIADLRSRIVDLQEDNAELELRIVALEKRMNETRIAQMTAAM